MSVRSGLILAGGLSSRMGREKGLIELGGRPIVLRVVDRLSDLVDEIVVATSPANDAAYRDVLPASVRTVADRAPNQGPLGGWQSGLPALRGDFVAIAPCDAPLYAPALGRLLLERARGHDGAVPFLAGRFEPLHGVYARERLQGAVERCIAAGRMRPIHTYAHLDVVRVEEADIRGADLSLESFMSANTPEELEVLRTRVEAGRTS